MWVDTWWNMAEDKPQEKKMPIEWIIGSAIVLFMLIIVLQVVEALKAESSR